MTTPVLRGSTAPLPGRPDGTPFGQNTLQATSPDATQVGDLVLAVTWHGMNGSVSALSLRSGEGWTQLVNYLHDDITNDGSLGIAWKIATQPGAQVYQAFNTNSPNTDARTALRVYEAGTFDVSGILASTPVSFTDGNLAPDPPTVSGLSATRNYLIEAIAGWWCSSGIVVVTPGAPSLYSNLIHTVDAGWLDLALSNREEPFGNTLANPATYTDDVDSTTNRGSVAVTIAILGAEGTARRAIIGWDELEVPDPTTSERRAIIGFDELEVPNQKYPDNLSFLFHPTWSRYRYQAATPAPNTERRAILSFDELEVPDLGRRAKISWDEFEVPSPVGQLGVGVRNSGPPQSWESGYVSIMGNRTPDVHSEFSASSSPNSWGGIQTPNFSNDSGNLDEYQSWFATRPTRRIEISLGMCPWKDTVGNQGVGLEAVANGSENARFASCARELQRLGMNGTAARPIYIRPGWEMGSKGFPWATASDSYVPNPTWMNWYKQAWVHIVTTMRNEVPSNWRFHWCPMTWHFGSYNSLYGLDWAEEQYPGNNYVDIIGADHYDGHDSYSVPPTQQQKENVWNTYHLNYLTNLNTFATSKGKPQAFGEWGIVHDIGGGGRGGDDNPYFIQKTYEWVTTHNFEYVIYFNRILAGDVEHSLSVDGSMSKANSRNMYNSTFSLLPHPW